MDVIHLKSPLRRGNHSSIIALKNLIGPILKENATELGFGKISLDTFLAIAIENGVGGAILEPHKNWEDNSPIKSLQVSAKYRQEKFKNKENYKENEK